MTADTFTAPTLSHVAVHGGKFCDGCERWSEATEDTEGARFERCRLCGTVGQMKYYPPQLQGEQEPRRSRSILP